MRASTAPTKPPTARQNWEEPAQSRPAMALAAGADGLLIEIHPDPDHALSDGAQSLNFESFRCLLSALRRLAEPLGKTIN